MVKICLLLEKSGNFCYRFCYLALIPQLFDEIFSNMQKTFDIHKTKTKTSLTCLVHFHVIQD